MLRVRIGDIEIFFINAGSLKLDGGSMFGSVPKELWNRWTPADEKNRIPLATRSMIIKSQKYCALIDGGVGSHWDARFLEMFAIEASPLEVALKDAANLRVDEVTDVIVSHWHFDHVGGLVAKKGDGAMEPVFKNARVHTQLANLNVAENPSDREKASYLSSAWLPYEKSGQLILSHLKKSLDTEEIFTGVHIQRTDGHTIGQQMVHIALEKEHLVFCADLIPTHHHLKPHYSMGFDVQPLILETEKKEMLKLAAKHNWVLVFEHDTVMPAAKVHQRQTSKGVVFELEPFEIV